MRSKDILFCIILTIVFSGCTISFGFALNFLFGTGSYDVFITGVFVSNMYIHIHDVIKRRIERR